MNNDNPIPFPVIRKERLVIGSGGTYDKTRCYAPSVIRRDGEYLLYYTGSNDNPSDRSGYRLLLARSKDGLDFKKAPVPVLDLFPEAKCYSAEALLQPCGCVRIYFAVNEGDGYRIFRASAEDPAGPLGEKKLVVDKSPLFSHSIHTIRLVKAGDLYHAYVAGSSSGARSQSKKYKHYRISSGFRIFHATSKDGKEFGGFKEIGLPPHSFINVYGHSAFIRQGVLYLIFTGFDGNAGCALYISASRDFENFSKPRLLFEPDEESGEIGMYSTSIIEIGKDRYRLFYGSREEWKYRGIASAIVEFPDAPAS